ncbi:hypothetical protein [Dinoroseobacter sp. S76]|uniref:hypothetical protein n=1 Tax=Dinoroseobacter sp. S76 TaxID=3415124 RepID=UPI003C7CECA3
MIGEWAATLPVLPPGVAAGLAAACLGEIPSLFDGLAIGLVVIGFVLHVSGPRPKAADLPSEQNAKAL